MIEGIIIFGLNGCGKSTICRELAAILNYKYMDIEDYYFLKSEIPYTKERTREDCIQVMQEDIDNHQKFVLSALTGDFGSEITSSYRMGVYIKVPHSIRVNRVKQRAIDKFGERVKTGGDMYESNEKFLSHVSTKTGYTIDKWRTELQCPVIEIDGTEDIDKNVNFIKQKYLETVKDRQA